MKLSLEQIIAAFGPLIKLHSVKVVNKRIDASFGNFIIDCNASDLDVRVIGDRGDAFIEIKSSGVNHWHRLEYILEFLGEKPKSLEPIVLISALTENFDKIRGLLLSDVTSLLVFEKQKSDEFIKSLFK